MITTITAAILSASLAAVPNPRELDLVQGDVRVVVEVNADLYTWTITNEGDTPITRFEIDSHNIYNHAVPRGWAMDTDYAYFHAWAERPADAIRPGRSGTFSGRVTSKSAVLGVVPTKVSFANNETLALDGVWGPAPKQKSHVWLVVGVLSGLALLHAGLLRVRSQRGQTADPE